MRTPWFSIPRPGGPFCSFIALMLLLSLPACAPQNVAPVVTAVEVPISGQAGAPITFVWTVALPESFTTASQFALYTDDHTHGGSLGTGIDPSLSGYGRHLAAPPEITGRGMVKVTFTVEEERPTRIFYRLHANVDGGHYWIPEQILTVTPQPAFTAEFMETTLNASLEDLALLGK